MAVTNLIGFLYDSISSSWTAATILIKYFLTALAINSMKSRELSLEKFQEDLLNYGRYMVILIGVTGFSLNILQVQINPLFLFQSQLIAITVLGFLFWKY